MGLFDMDKQKFLDYIRGVHAIASADLKQDHDEWSEAQMYLAGTIIKRITNGDFDV